MKQPTTSTTNITTSNTSNTPKITHHNNPKYFYFQNANQHHSHPNSPNRFIANKRQKKMNSNQLASFQGEHEAEMIYFNMGKGIKDEQIFEGRNENRKMEVMVLGRNKNMRECESLWIDKRQKESRRSWHSKAIKLQILKTEKVKQNDYLNQKCRKSVSKIDHLSSNTKVHSQVFTTLRKGEQKYKHQSPILLKFHQQPQNKQHLTHAHQTYFSRNSNPQTINHNKPHNLQSKNKMCYSKESLNTAETIQSNRLSNFHISSRNNQENIQQNYLTFHSRSYKDLSFKSKCFKFAQSKNIPNVDLIEVESILVLENEASIEKNEKQNYILDESIVLRGLEETIFDRALLSVGNV